MSYPDAALSDSPDRVHDNGPGGDAQPGAGTPGTGNEPVPAVPVLLLDDDAQILREYVDMLDSIGIQSHTATSAVRGLAMLEDHPEVGLVVADIRMPEMDGLRFASIVRQMKRSGPSPQFIFVTGYGEISAALAALRLEASDFLLKPVRRSDFLAAVRRAVQRVEADRAITSIQSAIAAADRRPLAGDRGHQPALRAGRRAAAGGAGSGAGDPRPHRPDRELARPAGRR